MNEIIDIGTIAAVIAVVLFGLIILVAKMVSIGRPTEKAETSEKQPAQESVVDPEIEYMENFPRCVVCGEFATEPMPQLVRKRTGLFRSLGSLLSLPVAYRRKVDNGGVFRGGGPRRLCKSDAHLADAEADLFLNDIKGEQAKLNNSVAKKVAQFETTLVGRLQEEKERQKPTVATPPPSSVSSLRALKNVANE